MTAPAASVCQHCKKRPVREWRQGVLGAKTVEISRCDCDTAHCPHKDCGKPLTDVPMFASRCPACEGPLHVRRTLP